MSNKYQYLENVYSEILPNLSQVVQKAKLSTLFKNIVLNEEDLKLLEKAKDLCEFKIIDLWDNQNDEMFKALCSTYFDIASALNFDNSDKEIFVYEQIKLFAMGYLGEEWHLVKQYITNRKSVFNSIKISEAWDKRLLFTSFLAIINLIKKDKWKDIDKAVNLINKLREEQKKFETIFLENNKENVRPFAAAELVALYHLAKSVDLLGTYFISGMPIEPEEKVKYHVNIAREFAAKSGNLTLELLLQFSEALFLKMIKNTVWYSCRGVNNWVSKYNKFITKRDEKGIFELLYPQRNSIIKGELLNPAHKAIILNLPTSSGKTLTAEYRILMALNLFKNDEIQGWVAYLVPTKALVNQVFIQLNRDLTPIGIKVEKASGALEIDGFEQFLVEDNGERTNFDVLVTTYEKMNLLIRQGLGTSDKRPLVLAIIDEAHNIEEKQRGLNLEMLIATIKSDCAEANFLLMTPDIKNSKDIVEWLAGDRGKVIDLDLDWWQPNERVVGALSLEGRGKNYTYMLQSLHTNKTTYNIGEKIPIIRKENSRINKSEITTSKKKIASYLSSEILDLKNPIIVLASTVNDTYEIADVIYKRIQEKNYPLDEDVDIVKRFVQTELGNDYPLVGYLDKRIAVHSSALPDEIRLLIEDLMAKGKLQALVATTTIAQGINFPVSAVVISSYNYPFWGPMPPRDFWNLAGRVGRIGQNSLGWIGIAAKNSQDIHQIAKYVSMASEELRSQLVDAIEKAIKFSDENFELWLWKDERWTAVFQYISHLRRQHGQLQDFISQLEQTLQRTLGYRQLAEEKRRFLKHKLREYVETISVDDAKRADETGFSTISLRQMIGRLARAGITPKDWEENQLFSEHNQTMKKLVGIMLKTYEIRKSFKDITQGQSLNNTTIAKLIINWVNGDNISSIAQRVFPQEYQTDKQQAIQKTSRALYKVITNAATWGLAALQKLPTSGIDWDNMNEVEKRKIANLPAYLYYGVNSDEAVLMRKNNVPRTVADKLGKLYKAQNGLDHVFEVSASEINNWLENNEVWNRAMPSNSPLSGDEYKKIWKKLNGEII
jgi:replicative superfamily II helicase